MKMTLFFLIGFILSFEVVAGSVVNWSGRGPYAEIYATGGLEFNDQKLILSGDVDPQSTAVSAPAGSLYLRDSAGAGFIYLKSDDGLSTNWQSISLSSLGSSTDNAVVRWNGTGGDSLQDSGVVIDDSANVTGVNDLTVTGSLSSADLTINSTQTINEISIDGTLAGDSDSAVPTEAAVKEYVDTGLAGKVAGPVSATDSAFALYDGTTGKLIKDSATTISTDDTLASDSNSLIPTEAAVKGYVDTTVGAFVEGPGPTVTTDSIVVWDGTGGYTVKGTPVTVNALGDIAGVNDLTATGDIQGGTITGTTSVQGGDLSLSGETITNTTTDGNVAITPNGSGEVVVSTLEVSDLTDTRIIVPDGANGLISTGVSINGTDDISGARHITATGDIKGDTLQLDTSVTIDAVLDEDNMASDSATAVPTQQSVRAYTDTTAAAEAASAVANRVIGPGPTSTDTQIAVFDGTGGYTIKGVPVLVDASGNMTGIGDLTASGVISNGSLQLDGTSVVSNGNIDLEPASASSVQMLDDNLVYSKVGTNNAELGQLMKYPSFEETGFDAEWALTNATISQEADGPHGASYMEITFSSAGSACIDVPTSGISGLSTRAQFQYSTTDAITLVGRSDGADLTSSAFTWTLSTGGWEAKLFTDAIFPQGTTSTGVCFESSGAATILVDGKKEDGGIYTHTTEINSELVETPWTAYTPTLGGITLGNGTLSAYYKRVGDSLLMKVSIQLGTTSSVGTGVTVSYPAGLTLSSKTTSPVDNVGSAELIDVSVASNRQVGEIRAQASDVQILSGTSTTITSSSPFTWASTDSISFTTNPIAIEQWDNSSRYISGTCSGGPLKCANDYYLKFTDSNTVLIERPIGWFTGISGTSTKTVSYDASKLGLTQAMGCTASPFSENANLGGSRFSSISTSSAVFQTFNNTGTAVTASWNLHCWKHEDDANQGSDRVVPLAGLNFSTSEIWTGGYDLSSSPAKPIFKRCARVGSNITTNNVVIGDWNLTTVTPVGIPNHQSTFWMVYRVNDSTGSAVSGAYFDKSDGDVKSLALSPYIVGAGTRLCMEYTYD